MKDTTRGISQIWLQFSKGKWKIVRIFAIFFAISWNLTATYGNFKNPKNIINK
jgi:hypothetical protein